MTLSYLNKVQAQFKALPAGEALQVPPVGGFSSASPSGHAEAVSPLCLIAYFQKL